MKVRLREVDAAAVDAIERDLRVRETTARCLAGRGVVSSDHARTFLEPRLAGLRPPTGLAGLADSIERIVDAVLRRQRIGVFGDYDVDGVTTAALLTTFLRSLGADIVPRVARRVDGYGFTANAAEEFVAAKCDLVITGDCGTRDFLSINRLAHVGCDVVVVDHHTVPDGDVAHPARALLNPFRADSLFPFRGLASVGLAFYLAAALRTALRDRGFFRGGSELPEPDVRQLLDLVALGTIADLVPLTHENRVLTALGLRQLATSPRPGIAALLQSAGVVDTSVVDAHVVSWKLAPRLNAPGRLGAAAPSLDLLLADREGATQCAAQIEAANSERRELQAQVMREAEAQLGDRDPGPAVVIAGEGWPAGVVGIVAAKLVDKYQRPAFVVAIDPASGEGRGSARTAGGVDLYRALAASSKHLGRFGGHAAAAGFALHRDNISAWRELLSDNVAQLAAGSGPVVSERCADAEVRIDQIDERLASELAALGPFGQQNPAPVLLLRGATVASARRVGDGSHLKLSLRDDNRSERSAIGFSLGDRPVTDGCKVSALFAPTISTWQGRQRVELSLHDVWVEN